MAMLHNLLTTHFKKGKYPSVATILIMLRCKGIDLFLNCSCKFLLNGSLKKISLMMAAAFRVVALCMVLRMTAYLSSYIYLSIYLSICLSLCLSVRPSIYLSIYLSICLCVCLSVSLSVCMYVCLSICLSVYIHIWTLFVLKMHCKKLPRMHKEPSPGR